MSRVPDRVSLRPLGKQPAIASDLDCGAGLCEEVPEQNLIRRENWAADPGLQLPYPLGKLRGLGCAGLAALATDEIRPPEEQTSIAVSFQTVSFVLCSRPPKKRSEPWGSETQSALCGWVGSKLARSIPPAQDRIETDWRELTSTRSI
jgi:hypothetical protein